jgi:hypothetical protein
MPLSDEQLSAQIRGCLEAQIQLCNKLLNILSIEKKIIESEQARVNGEYVQDFKGIKESIQEHLDAI